jgi:hypothetical protein
LPTSVQDQPAGQALAGAGGTGAAPGAPTENESMVDVAPLPFTPEDAASPTKTDVGIVSKVELPGTSV